MASCNHNIPGRIMWRANRFVLFYKNINSLNRMFVFVLWYDVNNYEAVLECFWFFLICAVRLDQPVVQAGADEMTKMLNTLLFIKTKYNDLF